MELIVAIAWVVILGGFAVLVFFYPFLSGLWSWRYFTPFTETERRAMRRRPRKKRAA